MNSILAGLLSLAAVSQAAAIAPRSSGTAYVQLAQSAGTATHLGSGFIYGFPDNGIEASNAIPDTFLTDIGFRAGRAGGAQIAARGWAYGGKAEYDERFQSTLSNYRTVRKYNADFILLVHDLWGADGGATESTPFPGDNGDWTEADLFLNQLISDMNANNMLDGVVIDIWNEPDGSGFWARPWDQYLEYVGHAHKVLKAAFPYLSISGPSMAHAPALDNSNWQTWFQYMAANDVIPDIYSWHQIGVWEREPDVTAAEFNTFREQYSLPVRPLDLNEYAWLDEQNPASTAYYLAQLERSNIRGLRANWGGGSNLHDFAAALLGKDENGAYYPNGEWQLYKYYADMQGDRAVTSASADKLFDVFAVLGDDKVKVLAGTRQTADAYDITITGLESTILGSSGVLNVRTIRFDWAGATGQIDAPVDLGTADYTYTDGSFTINLTPATSSTAYAYEFSL